MIYLIGGAPRIGKSVIGKELANRTQARFIATDDLDAPKVTVVWPSFSGNPEENTTSPLERINLQIAIAEALQPTIETAISQAFHDKKNLVIEGVHILPAHITHYIQKYNAKAMLLGWNNLEAVVKGIAQDTNQNNWLKDASEEVRRQVAEFTVAFSHYLVGEASKLNLDYIERSDNFEIDIRRALHLLK